MNKQTIKMRSHNLLKAIILTLSIFISIHVSGQKVKVAFVRNCITYGYDFSNPSSESYHGQMQLLLGTSNWEVGNFGDSGGTMLKEGGYSYWDSWQYNNALGSNPDVVVIGLGTNDSKKWLWDWLWTDFKSDYKEMGQSFQNLSANPDIWLFLIIPSEKPDWEIYDSYIGDKVNPIIKEVVLEKGLGLIDLYAAFDGQLSSSWYQADNIHPTTQV